MSDARPALRALAERLGIAAAYFEIGGTERRTSDAIAPSDDAGRVSF